MFLHSRTKDRPFHYGPFPLETLPRDPSIVSHEQKFPSSAPIVTDKTDLLSKSARIYTQIYARHLTGDPAKAKAPLPDDPERRAMDIKGTAYFMDASQVGICHIPPAYWLGGAKPEAHSVAIVMLIEYPRLPEPDNPARDWCLSGRDEVMRMRGAEISTSLAGHIRMMGFEATAHMPEQGNLDFYKLSVLAGLTVRKGDQFLNPYLGDAYALALVTTDYPLPVDMPLHEQALKAKTLAYWLGQNGARSGRERNRRAKRPTHLSRYPMETVKRVDRPTTLILDDEVPRVPKRAAFFQRALHGDLGDKAKTERGRFAFKTPLSFSLLNIIRALVPYQDGDIGERDKALDNDPAANSRAIKSLSYFLGSDLTGICEIPRYAWYSHKEDGSEIRPYHKYAVVMLIDQGYETMEAASGDDWMSGAQSMRGYLRGAEIAGVMAEFLRAKGIPSRAQTNADSDILQIPLILQAGLGELSRIGELVLNPFVGPRFKSVVLTTDLPLEVDKPIDFGLQTFCNNCFKCARECPCDAIPFGDKVMFNGYEIWKPDVERCTRYRVTNSKGSACGRCMKTCPINKVVDADGALLTRMASWMGIHAMWLKPVLVPIATWLDDAIGNGRRNLKKMVVRS